MLSILLLSALMQSATLVPPTQRGSDLYESCKAGVRAMDSPTAEMNDIAEGRVCMAYIDGVTSGDNSICADSASMGTLMRVYVAYMEKNPKMMDEPKNVGAHRAFAVEYPCPVKTTPQKQSGKK